MTKLNSAKNSPIHIRIRVPQHYQRQPVISRLISRYGLTVNIKAASLRVSDENYGWFDLELQGNPEKVVKSLSYMQGLGVDLMQIAIAGSIEPSPDSQFLQLPNGNNISNQSTSFTTGWEGQIYPQNSQINRLCLQICISKKYYHQPVISELVSHHGVAVNITGALLQPDVQGDGLFDLELWGNTEQLFSSWSYLQSFFC